MIEERTTMKGSALAGACFCALAISWFAALPAHAQQAETATPQYAAAAALQNREQYDLAADEWRKFLQNYPGDPRVGRARHYLGLCQLKGKQYAAAAETFDKLLADSSRQPPVADVDFAPSNYLYLGLAQYNLGQAGQATMLERAAQTFATLAKNFPQSKFLSQALYYQGETAYALGRKTDAARFYDQVVRQFPRDALVADALYALGVTQEETGQHAAADATYASFLTSFPRNALAAEVTMRRGDVLLAQGKIDEAEQRFAAAAAQPEFAMADLATMRQAACLFERKQFGPAANLYASVLQKFPKSQYAGAATLAAGKCAYLAGSYAEARRLLAGLSTSGGESGAEATHWIARSYLREKQPAEALQLLERPAAESPDKRPPQGHWSAQLALDRADALYDLPARQREALKAYSDLASQYPKDDLAPQALYMAAFAALGQADYAQALTASDNFLRQYPASELVPDVMVVAAESNLQKGDYPASARLYGELLTKFAAQKNAETWQVRQGLALYLDRKYDQAIARLEPIAAKLSTPELVAEAQFLLGTSYSELKQNDRAAAALEAALKADPKWRQADETLLALANVYRQTNQAPAAKRTLEKLLTDFPQSRFLDRAHFRLGECEYAADDLAYAGTEYLAVIDGFPKSALVPHALYGLAWVQLKQGNAAGAAKSLDRLLTEYPKSEVGGKARYARALARQQLKQFAPAVEDLQAFLATQPSATEQSDARYVLGLCQVGLKKPADAVATFGKLLKDDPSYVGADKALYELAWTLKSQGKDKESAATFERLALEQPKSVLAAEGLFHVGELYYKQGEFAKAAAFYHRATTHPESGQLGESASHKLAWAYFRMNEFDKARQTFNYERAKFPKGELNSDAAYMEGECLFKLGKFKEALELYAQVTKPKRAEFQALAALHSAEAAAQLQDWTRSLQLAEKAAKDFPQSDVLPEMLYAQGWAKQNLGKPDEAIPLYESVAAKTDREVAARARFMIGEIYFEKKDHNEAVRNFFKVAYGYSYPVWQAAAQYESGRCFEVLGKLDQAKKSYLEVVEKYPNDEKAALAKQRLEQLAHGQLK
jgi:TolA-binding protein